jgi:signal peptidase I
VAGDTVELRRKTLYVNGVPREESYIQNLDTNVHSHSQGPRDNMGPIVVPEGHIFMLGDNRDNSHDSRFWGPLPTSSVRGKAMFIYFSIDTTRGLFPPRLRVTRIGDIIR